MTREALKYYFWLGAEHDSTFYLNNAWWTWVPAKRKRLEDMPRCGGLKYDGSC